MFMCLHPLALLRINVHHLYFRCVLSVSLTHGCIPALQQRFGVPQQQSVVGIHDVGLVLGLSFFPLCVGLIESLLIVLLKHGTLKQLTK